MTRLLKPKAFFDVLRGTRVLGPTLEQGEVDGCNVLTHAMGAAGWGVAWTAYGLATAYHETRHTMQPIKEDGGDAYFFRMYDKAGLRPQVAARLGNTQPGDGVKFCGRGYPQVTGRTNYARVAEEFGIRCLEFPNLLLDAKIAAPVTVRFMEKGWFTGKKLGDYLPVAGRGSLDQFKRARRVINGTDKDALIAGYALVFQHALETGAWS